MRPRASYVAMILIAACMAVATEPIRPPNTKEGQINGIVAMMFWPANDTTGGKVDAFLSTDDCLVILASWKDFSEERSYRCGVWFQPPEGRYRAWLEKGDDQISQTSATINYAPVPFKGQGSGVVMPVGPAGRVVVAPEISLPPNTELSIINFDSCCRGSKFGTPFSRRGLASAPELRKGLAVPVGNVFAGIFDRTTREAIAITRPVRVDTGKLTAVAPRPPSGGLSDVFVSLSRPPRPTREDDLVEITLDGKKPQMLFDGSDRIYAAWFGINGSTAQFAVASKALRLQARTLKLTAGHVTTVRGELQRLPSVAVSLLAPPNAFDDETVRVEVRQPAHAEALQSIPIQQGDDARLQMLPAEPLDIVLSVGPWRFRKQVDLTSGVDEKVVFDLHPILVSGEVFYGRERAANAEVAFEADEGFVRVKSDGEGRYQATLWRGSDAWLAEVAVPNRAGPPFVDGFVQINESATLDFHVPRTDYKVRVVDADSGKGISGASVAATNIFAHASGEEATLLQRATTDDDGVAFLAPLRPGKLAVNARAAGYRDSENVDGGIVKAAESEGNLEVRLQSVGETVRLHLRMDDGAPVARAELWAVAATNGTQRPLWRGESDADGVTNVPRNVDSAILLIRSSSAASAVRSFKADAPDHDIILQPAAPPIRVNAYPRTRIAFWIDGVRVSGPAVSFLGWSSEISDPEGTWSARNLPRQSLRLLAWQRVPEREIVSGLRDASVTTIPYPWPSTVTLRSLE